ncbi:Uncharacterised protein [Mycobacteroides abscessus]|nr:Uncharacterised protein [Mycobacteroides abscessus]
MSPHSTGSVWSATRNGWSGSNPVAPRPSVTARSNRKPSTPTTSAQYRSESSAARTTAGRR